MAKEVITNFKNFFKKYVGVPAALEDVIVCPVDTTLMILGLDICNVLDTGITVDVVVYDATADDSFYLLKNAPIPVGSTLQVISKQKHVLEVGDKIQIQASAEDAVQVVGCSMEVFTLV